MRNGLRRFMWTPSIPGTLALLLVAVPAAMAAGVDFTFRDAEFMSRSNGYAAAERFVADRFPPGLPMAEARLLATRAAMSCRTTRVISILTCRYSIPVHAEGGLIGDNTWTLRLTSDPLGRLRVATLHYDRGGVED